LALSPFPLLTVTFILITEKSIDESSNDLCTIARKGRMNGVWFIHK
jgi:hypothetical protein